MFLRFSTPSHAQATDWLRSHGFAYIAGEGFCNNAGDKATVCTTRLANRPLWQLTIPYTHKPR